MLRDRGYSAVLGIDSDPAKVEIARRKGLPCEVARAFEFLDGKAGQFDVIIPEQELNHLTLDETIEFLELCRQALRPGGRVIVYAMNGANPLVGSENLAHNIDHFYNVTEYSLEQILNLAGFQEHSHLPAEAVRVLEESTQLRRAGGDQRSRAHAARRLQALRQESAHSQQENRRNRQRTRRTCGMSSVPQV